MTSDIHQCTKALGRGGGVQGSGALDQEVVKIVARLKHLPLLQPEVLNLEAIDQEIPWGFQSDPGAS